MKFKFNQIFTAWGLQKQRIFFVKSLFKKKYKTKFIYLLSKRKSVRLFVKPQHVVAHKKISFLRNNFVGTQQNLYLRGLTGLPLNNINVTFSFLDFNSTLARINLRTRAYFEFFNFLRKTMLSTYTDFLSAHSIKYSSNVLYSFVSWNRNILNTLGVNSESSDNIVSNFITRHHKLSCYIILIKNIYKNYLLILNLKILHLKNSLHIGKMCLFFLRAVCIVVRNNIQNKSKKLCFNISFYFNLISVSSNHNKNQKLRWAQNLQNKQKKIFVWKKSCLFCKSTPYKFTKAALVFSKFKYISYMQKYLLLFNKFSNLFYIFNKFFFYYFFKVKFFLKKKLIDKLKICLKKNKLVKKINLYYFNKFFNKTGSNFNICISFFFKNFSYYNVKFFKKYWKFIDIRNQRHVNSLKKKNKKKRSSTRLTISSYLGLDARKLKFMRLLSLFYFFSLLVNRQHWFYFYKTYMPLMRFKSLSCSNLNISYKIKYYSWFQKNRVNFCYKNNLCLLNNKNKFIYLMFYHYLYFKQLAGLKIYNFLFDFYKNSVYFYFNTKSYYYLDIIADTINFSKNLNSTKIFLKKKKNRFHFFRKILTMSSYKGTPFVGLSQNVLQDFSQQTCYIISQFINYKYINILKLQKQQIFYSTSTHIGCYTKNKIYLFFFFKLFSSLLKKILLLKFMYYAFFFNKLNLVYKDNVASVLHLNFMSIFDIIFIIYSNYFILLKLIINLLKYYK